jgi:hypothetical protein
MEQKKNEAKKKIAESFHLIKSKQDNIRIKEKVLLEGKESMIKELIEKELKREEKETLAKDILIFNKMLNECEKELEEIEKKKIKLEEITIKLENYSKGEDLGIELIINLLK